MRALRLLPPLGWTALIAWFSTDQWSGASTHSHIVPLLRALWPGAAPEALEALHGIIRKLGHVIEYGALAALWAGALGGWTRALGLSALTAVLDELHQATTSAREGSVADVLLDSMSAAAVLLVARAGLRPALARVTGTLLWVAAGGGTILLGVDWLAGAPSAWLWLSTPAAWLALWLWSRRRRP